MVEVLLPTNLWVDNRTTRMFMLKPNTCTIEIYYFGNHFQNWVAVTLCCLLWFNNVHSLLLPMVCWEVNIYVFLYLCNSLYFFFSLTVLLVTSEWVRVNMPNIYWLQSHCKLKETLIGTWISGMVHIKLVLT